ncbi:DUF7519 family protein [Halomarina oriensis]|uniref:Uncharacterized protein n=1 Tax=Halomarina oriensis TaxID=671145 RepID=A0A6B0GEI7_9EURY|nr:hypothetical protein [Halomarina oriensis]MWG33222.1 hypothetical protein [Halomarina oriensis]
MTNVVYRPSRVSSAIAVLAAAGCVAAVGSVPEQYTGIAVTLGGVLVLALGTALYNRGIRFLGFPVALVGLLVAFGGFAVGVALVGSYQASLTLRGELLGLLGVPFIALGVVPLSRRLSRRLVSLGFALLVIGVVFVGAFNGTGTDPLPLLVGMVAAIVAWDAAEQAINLGNQLGTRARTWPSELSHSGGTTLFGGVGIGAGLVMINVNVTDLPLASLLLLLGAALVLMVALYK